MAAVMRAFSFVVAATLLALGCGGDDSDGCRCGGGGESICLCDGGVEESCAAAGGLFCGSRCVLQPASDPDHCGACGNRCGSNGYCLDGRCSTCPADEVACGTMCCPDGCTPDGSSCVAAPCGAEPPEAGTGCGPIGRHCTYLRCDTVGNIRADCVRSGWRVETWPCEEVDCRLDEPCGESELCVVPVGSGSECAANPCGEGAVEPPCACEPCGAGTDCSVGSLGRVVSCWSE